MNPKPKPKPNLAHVVDEFLELNDGTFQYTDRDTGRIYMEQIKWPQLVTEKFDGIRVHKENGIPYTRSGKAIPNHNIREALEMYPLDNFDAEICLKDTLASFDEVQSAIMSREGIPEVQVMIFDRIYPRIQAIGRVQGLGYTVDNMDKKVMGYRNVEFKAVEPIICRNLQQLQKTVNYLAARAEGACFKWAESFYKRGRGTLKDQTLLKFKPFVDDEAIAIGFEELLINTNDQETNELGMTKRSKRKAGMIPANTLGSLVVLWKGQKRFTIGSGLNEKKRKHIWAHRKHFLGKTVCFKYQKFGMKQDGSPRTPIYKGFRDISDLGE